MSKKIFFIALVVMMFMTFTVNAGSITIKSSASSLEIGQTATITITGVNATGQVNITSSNSSVATVSQSSGWVENNSITVTVTAKAAGTAQIVVKPDPNGEVVDSTTAEVVTGSKSVNITVTAPVVEKPEPEPKPEQKPETEPITPPTTTETPDEPEAKPEPTKSSNANLSNLGIRPNDFTGFKAGTTSYNVSVPYDVSSIEVYASKGHSAQTISGTGTKSLSEGSNSFSVEVTAEDGTKKTYKITVVRLAKEEVPEVEEPEIEVALASLEIQDVTLNEAFKPETLEYTAIANENAEKVVVKATVNVENAKIEVTGAEEYETGENTIRVTVKSKDGKNSKTYVIKVTKEDEAIGTTDEENIIPVAVGSTTNNNQGGNGGIGMEKLFFCIGVGVIALLGVVFAVIRYNKDKDETFDGEVSFENGFSAKNAIRDAAVATSKLSSINLEDAQEEMPAIKKNRGRHF